MEQAHDEMRLAERYEMRRELSKWSERDLHDIGVSSADVAYELDKPFWRA